MPFHLGKITMDVSRKIIVASFDPLELLNAYLHLFVVFFLLVCKTALKIFWPVSCQSLYVWFL